MNIYKASERHNAVCISELPFHWFHWRVSFEVVDIPVFYAYGISVYIVFYQFPFSFISLVTFNVGGRRQRNKDLLRLDFRKLFHFFYIGNVNDANSKQNGRLNHDCEEMLNNIEIIRSIPQFWILILIAWPCYWSYFWQP